MPTLCSRDTLSSKAIRCTNKCLYSQEKPTGNCFSVVGRLTTGKDRPREKVETAISECDWQFHLLTVPWTLSNITVLFPPPHRDYLFAYFLKITRTFYLKVPHTFQPHVLNLIHSLDASCYKKQTSYSWLLKLHAWNIPDKQDRMSQTPWWKTVSGIFSWIRELDSIIV